MLKRIGKLVSLCGPLINIYFAVCGLLWIGVQAVVWFSGPRISDYFRGTLQNEPTGIGGRVADLGVWLAGAQPSGQAVEGWVYALPVAGALLLATVIAGWWLREKLAPWLLAAGVFLLLMALAELVGILLLYIQMLDLTAQI